MTVRLPWHIAGLLAVGIAAVVLAILEIGPSTSRAARTERETVTAERGVVQSTVTGDGNVAAGVDDEVNFQTSGTLKHVDVRQGQHVVKGQLLATLSPSSDQDTVDEDRLDLDSAEDSLKNAEEEQTSGTSDTREELSGSTTDDVSLTTELAPTATTSTQPTTPTTTTPTTTSTPTTATPTTTTTATPTTTTTTTTTTPAPTSTTTAAAPTTTTRSGRTTASGTTTTGAGSATGGAGGTSATGGSDGSTSSSSGSSTSAAQRAGDIASAKSSIMQARATLATAEHTLRETRLYAPATGTIVSLEALSAGDAVTGASSSSDTSASTASSTGAGASGSSSSAGTGAADGSSTSSTSSSAFAEIVNSRKLTMTVSFDESDISAIRVGQPATVTIEALTGVELGARVTSISTVGTESSDVVSYDATLTVDQHDAQVKPGMSADATVITKQASGVTLPTDAVTGTGSTATLQVLKNGKTTPTTVDVGLRGTNRVQIVGGLSAGQQVQVTETLPAAGSSSTSSSGAASSGITGSLGSGSGRFGGSGFGGGGGGFGGGAGGFAAP